MKISVLLLLALKLGHSVGLTSKQTVIHMSVLWPRFHLEQFHGGH